MTKNNTKKPVIKDLAFSIIHFCNYNCTGCSTYSDVHFTGYSKWTDYKDIYSKWSERISLEDWCISGGEVTYNPTLPDWVDGICNLWSNSKGIIRSNGSIVHKPNKKLYDCLTRNADQVLIYITLHNDNDLYDEIHNWLQGNITVTDWIDLAEFENINQSYIKQYNSVKSEHWPNLVNVVDDWSSLSDEIKQECVERFNFNPNVDKIKKQYVGKEFKDTNGVTIRTISNRTFLTGSLEFGDDKKHFKLKNSDPEIAHSVCNYSLCHTMYQGKLYKCPTVVALPDFSKQFYLDVHDTDVPLLTSYKPGTVDMSDNDFLEFVNQLPDMIKQCKFCPESFAATEVTASTKKIKFIKRIQNDNSKN